MRNALAVTVLLSVSVFAQTKKPPLYFSGDLTAFYSVGKWEMANNEKMAFPTETEIDCDPGGKFCVESTADYSFGKPHVNVEFFLVVKWDRNGIVATSSNSICMVRTLVISFPDKSITGTRSLQKMTDEKREACKTFGAEGTDSEVFVVKNSERWIADVNKGETR
jgi:hypothetical protein